jgi:adenylate cyclase
MRIRRRKRVVVTVVTDVNAPIDQLALQALSTEKLRVIVLLIITGLMAIQSLVPPSMLSSDLGAALQQNMGSFMRWRFAIVGFLIVYLVAQRLLVAYLIKTHQGIPPVYPFITALIEISMPTAGLVMAATYASPGSPVPLIPVFLYHVFIVLSALRLSLFLSLFTGAVAAIEFLVVSRFYLDRMNFYRPIQVPIGISLLVLGAVTGFVGREIRKRMVEANKLAEERNNIVHMFGRHVSPAVVNELLASGSDLRGEKKSVCVMFLDIRNFTSFAEKKSPEEVVYYLEHLFDFMIEIVNRNHGIINKFLGDGFMAVFGAPISDGHNCVNAVQAAKEILMRLKIEIAQGNVPPTRVGIGLHSGDAVMGSIGSALRREYTVIGDVVNLASRIEKLNKEFDSELLISEEVKHDALSDNLSEAISMGHVQVRGREEPIQIYQLA